MLRHLRFKDEPESLFAALALFGSAMLLWYAVAKNDKRLMAGAVLLGLVSLAFVLQQVP